MIKYFVINHDTKTITRYNTLKEARLNCQIALKFSRSLCVFFCNSIELAKNDIDLNKFKLVIK